MANDRSQKKSDSKSIFQFVDNRREAHQMKALKEVMNNSPRVARLKDIQEMANESNSANQVSQLDTVKKDGSSVQLMRRALVGVSRKLSSYTRRSAQPPHSLISPRTFIRSTRRLAQQSHSRMSRLTFIPQATSSAERGRAQPPAVYEPAQPPVEHAYVPSLVFNGHAPLRPQAVNGQPEVAPVAEKQQTWAERLRAIGLDIFSGLGNLDDDPTAADVETIRSRARMADDLNLEGEERKKYIYEYFQK